jgi:hypothetical protein
VNATPGRLTLLRAIREHEDNPQRGVFAVARPGMAGFDSYHATADRGEVKVTAEAEKMLDAGWIERPAAGRSFFSRRWYRLRPAGVAVLDTHPQEDR